MGDNRYHKMDENQGWSWQKLPQQEMNKAGSYDGYGSTHSSYDQRPDYGCSRQESGFPVNRQLECLPTVEIDYQKERAEIEAHSRFPEQCNIDQVPLQEIASELCCGKLTPNFYLKAQRVFHANGDNGPAAIDTMVYQLNFGLASLGCPYRLNSETTFTPYGPRVLINFHDGPLSLGKVFLRK